MEESYIEFAVQQRESDVQELLQYQPMMRGRGKARRANPVRAAVLVAVGTVLSLLLLGMALRRYPWVYRPGYGLAMYTLAVLLLVVYLLLVLALALNKRLAQRRFEDLPQAGKKRIDGKGIYNEAQDGSYHSFYAWNAVKKVLVSPNLYIFELRGSVYTWFNRCDLQGREAELEALIHTYMQPDNIRRV